MAGDWIKMRVDLATDPAVISISSALDVTEFEVVGMLHRFWSWADAQSRDGHAAGVTKKWINRYVHCEGFAEQLEKVGWLQVLGDGVELPNFGRHNGSSAKARALAANRQQNKRGRTSLEESRTERDECVTREEKRREEKKEDKSSCDQQADHAPEPVDRIDYSAIAKAFREKLPALPQIRDMTDKRKKAVRSIVKRGGRYASADFFPAFFEFVSKSDFLMGRSDKNPWHGCCFDWLIKPENFQKIIEGNYHPET